MRDANRERLRAYAARWDVSTDEEILETASSLIAFGRRDDAPVALKIVKRAGDEWKSGEVVRAFGGRGMVRALEFDDGAMLLERLTPGHSLVEVVVRGDDDGAASILADVMRELLPDSAPEGTSTVEDWAGSFEKYRSSGDRQIPPSLVDDGRRVYLELCATQTSRRLLHGDLQHTNILLDARRGWIAIDPKGVIGEREFEVGPLFRNPVQTPHVFSELASVERRLGIVCARAGLSYDRALRWVFAEAVLSAIWGVEDDGFVRDDGPSLTLARTLWPAITNRS